METYCNLLGLFDLGTQESDPTLPSPGRWALGPGQFGEVVQDVNWEPKDHRSPSLPSSYSHTLLCQVYTWPPLGRVCSHLVDEEIEGTTKSLVESDHLDFFSSLPLPLDQEHQGSLAGPTAERRPAPLTPLPSASPYISSPFSGVGEGIDL